MKMKTKTKNIVVWTWSLCCLFTLSCAWDSDLDLIGINYGRQGNNLPSPYQSIDRILSMNATYVKLYNSDSEVLKLLAGTGLHVAVMISNDQISGIASNQSIADKWLRENVLAYYPGTKIRFILVGNEVFSYDQVNMWFDLVPAMRRLKRSLIKYDIHSIKVGSPVAMDILESTFPPSKGRFRSDIPIQVISSFLRFLNGTKSFFFLDIYPYFSWSSDPKNMDLDFALLKVKKNSTYVDPHSGLVYTNMLDQMLDSVTFAMGKAGFDNISIAISETGWPHSGDIDQPGANAYNAAVYNRNLISKMTTYPPLGTPARPGVEILTFIFSLYDENQKPGPGTERHWGLLDTNGNPFYELDLTGTSQYRHSPKPVSNEPYKGKLWCVAANNASEVDLTPALDFACRHVNGTCSKLAPGKPCYEPISVNAHASYAFSSYWAQYRNAGASCFFNGVATQTTVDPSHGLCQFPSVTV
ncbi:probable glucan endo-1,3-beta-glucosidase A6 isoform X2 [Andrographis paniculata]|nr:probable glucan endo-1,3-beta-glucosidase A6 isoform X2 [Andrographis paniculata]